MRRGWTEKSIDELAFVGRGKSRHRPRNDPSLYGGEHPFVQTAEIHNADLWITSFKQTYSDKGLAQSKMWDPGTICITNAGENTGDCAILGIRACFPDSIIAVIGDESKSDTVFLKYAIDQLKPRLRHITRGATQDNLSVAKLNAFKFPTPPLKEQRRIGVVLRAYGDLIENNRRRIQLLEQAARLLYKEWFVHLRFPGHEHVKIKDGVPEGWERRSLGEVVEIKKGKNITQATTQEGTVPVIAGGLEAAYYHNEANVVGPVVTISASGANAGFVSIYHEDIWASDCSYISSDSTSYLYYLYCFLKSRQLEVLGLQKGAAQPHVYPKDLMRLAAVRPPDKFLQYFTDAVAPSFALIKNLGKQNKLLAAARDLLLPRLMNGEISV
jgi:type I restriction enzyme S subunit